MSGPQDRVEQQTGADPKVGTRRPTIEFLMHVLPRGLLRKFMRHSSDAPLQYWGQNGIQC